MCLHSNPDKLEATLKVNHMVKRIFSYGTIILACITICPISHAQEGEAAVATGMEIVEKVRLKVSRPRLQHMKGSASGVEPIRKLDVAKGVNDRVPVIDGRGSRISAGEVNQRRVVLSNSLGQRSTCGKKSAKACQKGIAAETP